jgi:tetratricopeptide (TPR) repeat protein
MATVLRLEVTQFDGPAEWRWVLKDQSQETIAEHRVDIDTACWQFEAMQDLYAYLAWHAAPDRRLTYEAELVSEFGAWVGEHIFGPVGVALGQRSPAIIRVVVPREARIVASYPLECAIVAGRPLALQQVGLVFDVGGVPAITKPKRPVGERLRILGLFSLPEGTSALDLRKERTGLSRLVRTIADTNHTAIELKVVQYGVSRARLREIVEDVDGWDILHLSGHGRAGAVLLEKLDGSPDAIETGQLVDLLEPLAKRVKLVTVSSCSSAALPAAELLLLLGSAAAPTAREPASQDKPIRVNDSDTAGVPALSMELASRLDCAVLAMRFPVTADLATGLAEGLYAAVIGLGQSLPAALSSALPSIVRYPPTVHRPALSVATPAIFGGRALDADTAICAPHGELAADDEQARKLRDCPPPPPRLVGRVGVMARAAAALAPSSGTPGVILHGMAGAGKTACAAELAHTHYDSFDRVVWFKAPDEGADIADALSRFARQIETQIPELLFAHLLEDEMALARFLPGITEFAERNRVLIIVDNAESLLTATGAWGDNRWRLVIGALTVQQGPSRLVITSRRPVSGPDGLQIEMIHALSRDEAVLLARELPHLRALLDGQAEGLSAVAARELARWVLAATQGHPQLLELADGQAADIDRLRTLRAAADHAWIVRGGLPAGFFTSGESAASAEDYADVLTAWTRTVTDGLPEEAQAFFEFLCSLEESDRHGPCVDEVIAATWPDVRSGLDMQGKPAEIGELVDAIAAIALLATDRDSGEGRVVGYRIHPVVAMAGRERAGARFQAAVDTELARYWTATADVALEREAVAETSGLVVRAGLAAAPYLLRLHAWEDVGQLLDRVLQRDDRRATVVAVLPALGQIVRVSIGTDREFAAGRRLAFALGLINMAAAERLMQEQLAAVLARHDYEAASAIAGDLAWIHMRSGRFDKALRMAERCIVYTRQTGWGPWTQLGDEVQRLQVLAFMGKAGQVLAEVERLRVRVDALPEAGDQSEMVKPWTVRERLLDVGRTAALQLKRWEEAVDLNNAVADSQRARAALETEIARTRFNGCGPLLKLGRLDEALTLLRECRETFSRANDVRMLGNVFSMLAAVERERGHGEVALSLARDALRYGYLADDMDGIPISHHNLGIYLREDADDAGGAVTHHLAAALIYAVTGGQYQRQSVQEAASDLRRLSDTSEVPNDVTELCRRVGEVPGARLGELLTRFAPNPETLQQTLRELITQADGMAASSGTPSN